MEADLGITPESKEGTGDDLAKVFTRIMEAMIVGDREVELELANSEKGWISDIDLEYLRFLVTARGRSGYYWRRVAACLFQPPWAGGVFSPQSIALVTSLLHGAGGDFDLCLEDCRKAMTKAFGPGFTWPVFMQLARTPSAVGGLGLFPPDAGGWLRIEGPPLAPQRDSGDPDERRYWKIFFSDLSPVQQEHVKRTGEEALNKAWWGSIARELQISPEELLEEQVAVLRPLDRVSRGKHVVVSIPRTEAVDGQNWIQAPLPPRPLLEPTWAGIIARRALECKRRELLPCLYELDDQGRKLIQQDRSVVESWLRQRLPTPSCTRFGRAPDVASAVVGAVCAEHGPWPASKRVTMASLERRAVELELAAGSSPLWLKYGDLRG
jgi:hypothetical protein